MSLKVKRNDLVQVLRGKDRNRRGRVIRVIPDEGRVVVEGINIVKKHVRPRPGLRQAGIVEMEAPIHISKVILVCPKCNRPARVGFRFLQEAAGKPRKVRYCKKCGEVID
jgi:large subunit ribosomal protein L24